jgi:hypothetical protein
MCQPIACRSRGQMVAAHNLLAIGFTAAGVWSSTTTLMLATQLPFNQPLALCRSAAQGISRARTARAPVQER